MWKKLLFKYGIPLAVKLLSDGKDEKETTEIIEEVVYSLQSPDIVDYLLDADEEQTNRIVQGLYDVATGVGNSVQSLVDSLARIFKPLPKHTTEVFPQMNDME